MFSCLEAPLLRRSILYMCVFTLVHEVDSVLHSCLRKKCTIIVCTCVCVVVVFVFAFVFAFAFAFLICVCALYEL